MSPASGVAVAAIFVWLGMVLAISFIEAPLKFRAPGVTLQIGLGIGRLVFRALNGVRTTAGGRRAGGGRLRASSRRASGQRWRRPSLPSALLAQVLLVRPRLTRRSDAVLAGDDGPRSRAHWAYIGLEVVKVAALLIAGVLLLAA